MMSPLKSAGRTASEKYLARLCEKSFLRLWSYANLYRDQGQRGKGDGKELCDLLVLFGSDIIIFSDKSCHLTESGDDFVDWRRWFRRAIQKSANQAFGAEKWIREHPNRIYLDPACTQPFPLRFPSPDQCRIHRVVVARNASRRSREFFGRTGSGSLMLNSGVVCEGHLARPFTIGLIAPTKGYVHVLDDSTLDVILGELDTITDFTAYLTKKESLIMSNRLVIAAGEEELLAYYLTHGENGEHDFIFDEHTDAIWFDENSWVTTKTDARYVAKKNADRVSYLWDMLIETYHQHFLDGTLLEGSNLVITDHEIGLRIMASEPRLSRRHLVQALGDVMERAPPGKAMARTVMSRDRSGVAYVFLIVPPDDGTHDEYRKLRRSMLWAYCLVARLHNPKLKYVVGIGAEPMNEPEHSYDLLCFDTSHWAPALEAEAQRLHDQGILRRPTLTHHRTLEYPE